jgi:hypothetical protein
MLEIKKLDERSVGFPIEMSPFEYVGFMGRFVAVNGDMIPRLC